MAVFCGTKASILLRTDPTNDLGLDGDTSASGQEVLLSSQISLLQRWLFSNMMLKVVAVIVDGCVCVCVLVYRVL